MLFSGFTGAPNRSVTAKFHGPSKSDAAGMVGAGAKAGIPTGVSGTLTGPTGTASTPTVGLTPLTGVGPVSPGHVDSGALSGISGMMDDWINNGGIESHIPGGITAVLQGLYSDGNVHIPTGTGIMDLLLALGDLQLNIEDFGKWSKCKE
jgi:hypothetical protein